MTKLQTMFQRINSMNVIAYALTMSALVVAAMFACTPAMLVVETVVVEREVTVQPEVVVQTVVVERDVTVNPEVVVHTVVVERAVMVEPVVEVQTVIVEREVTAQPEVVVKTVVVDREVTVEPVVIVKEILVEREVTVEPEVVVKQVVVEREVKADPAVVVHTVVVEREVTVAPEVIVPTVIVETTPGEKIDAGQHSTNAVCRDDFELSLTEPEIWPLTALSAGLPDSAGGGGSRATSASGGAPPPVVPSWPRVTRPPSTTFADNQSSEFVQTSEDEMSTFSLDTDRTSFHLALNWSRSGYEIVPDSVRAEEWINSFDYGYHVREDGTSFDILSDFVEHPLDPRLRLVRIAFQAPEVHDDSPVNVTLVLDASGSMADGNRVEIAREAAEALRDSLRSDDRISVVHFTTDVINEYTVQDAHPDDIASINSIARLAPHDSTNVQAGLNLGVHLAHKMRQRRPGALNYVVLMSDGVANVDATNPFAILDSATDVDPRNPLRLITVGVGINNYNDVLLEQLAQHGNGWYRYLSEPWEGRQLFNRENWIALSVPFADQTRAQVTWNPEHIERWRLIGYENRVTSDESFTSALKKFAEIPSGAATTVFFEVEPKTTVAGENNDPSLGNVELRWVSPKDGTDKQQESEIAPYLDAADGFSIFGAIVALASDRYSGVCEVASDNVYAQLTSLGMWLQAIQPPISDTDAFRDFQFVLSKLIQSAKPPPPTGYSR